MRTTTIPFQSAQELQKEPPLSRTAGFAGKFAIVVCGVLLGYTTYAQPAVSVGVSVPLPSVEIALPSVEIHAESDFYEPLTPHGEWVVIGGYGRCWRPGGVEAGWRPYCNGNWQRTEAGWYWASDEPWAWATYHYGRWDFTAQFGWYWVPQTQWAPAWVSWHEGGGYIGWAPLLPSVRVSATGFVGFNIALISPQAFVFVEQRRFADPIRPTTVVLNNTTIINKTVTITNIRIVNNTVINEGPATAVIEKASGRKVQAVPVQELRHKQEAMVVARRTSTSTSAIPTPVHGQAEPRAAKTVAAPELPQLQKAAVASEPAGPVRRNHEAQSENPKPVPGAPEFKPQARPEGNHPAVNKQSTEQQADKHIEKHENPAKPSERKVQRPGREKAVPEKNEPNRAEKNNENKGKE